MGGFLGSKIVKCSARNCASLRGVDVLYTVTISSTLLVGH